MSNPFLGEIRIVGFYFAPVGWAMCNGQLLSISQNMALFSLLAQRTVETDKPRSRCRTFKAALRCIRARRAPLARTAEPLRSA